ncbi:MAG: hypothetical protein AAFN17_06770 [Pseudomonadota bacterium]
MQPIERRRSVEASLPGARPVVRKPQRDVVAGGCPDFPRILTAKRRRLFALLLLNGAGQAGGALALPLFLSASGSLGSSVTVLGLAAITGGLIALRIRELHDAERLGLDYVSEVRLRLFDGLVEGRGTDHGVAMSRLMNDLSALRQWVGLGLARSFSAAMAFCGCAIAAAMMSQAHLVAILGPAFLVLIAGAAALLPLARRVREVRRRRGKLAKLLGESLAALPEIQNREARLVRRRVARASAKLREALLDRIRVASVLRVLPDAVLPLVLICAVATGLETGDMQLGLILLAGLAAGPLTQGLRAAEYRIAFSVARDRLSPALSHGRETEHSRPHRKDHRDHPQCGCED